MTIPRSEFGSAKIEVGARFEAKGAKGVPITLEVQSVDKEKVTAKVVHALADKDLEFRVKVLPVRGAASPCAVLRFRWGSRVVLFTGEIPDPISIEPDSPTGRWIGRPPRRADEVLESLPAIGSPAPDLWLPLHPLHAQNANLYDEDWARTMRHNLDCLSRREGGFPCRCQKRPGLAEGAIERGFAGCGEQLSVVPVHVWRVARCAVVETAPPNEMRLSCGANWTISQTDGLHSKTAPSASGAC